MDEKNRKITKNNKKKFYVQINTDSSHDALIAAAKFISDEVIKEPVSVRIQKWNGEIHTIITA